MYQTMIAGILPERQTLATRCPATHVLAKHTAPRRALLASQSEKMDQ